MVFDGLDGRVARITNIQCEFGAEYDTLAGRVSFAITPDLVAYNQALSVWEVCLVSCWCYCRYCMVKC